LCGYCEKGLTLRKEIKELQRKYEWNDHNDEELENVAQKKAIDSEFTQQTKSNVLEKIRGYDY
jgi:hypothetical protein